MLPIAIIAGGLGTRLLPLTQRVPKALIPVGGIPFIDRQLALLRANGFERAVLCVSHLGDQIEAHVGDGRALGMEIRYSYDGEQRVGTAGALKRALPLLGETFFSIYGDSYLRCDYAAVERIFTARRELGLMTVVRNDGTLGPSNVAFADGRIRAYDKVQRTAEMRHIDYGLSAFRAAAFADVPADRPTDLTVVFQELLARDQLAAFEVTERFYEVGTPESVAELEALLAAEGGAGR